MSATFLVFDLDGTISDPTVGFARSVNYALGYFGYTAIAESELTQYIGPPLDASFSAMTGDSSTEHIAALVLKYRERYAEVGYSENVLYPGIPDALAALASAGVPMGLCTSKRADFADQILRMFALRQHFRFLCGGEIGLRKQQQLATLLAEQTISPASIMIGDRDVDVKAAKDNGLRSVGVRWGHGSLEELQAAGADILLESPLQLTSLLTMNLSKPKQPHVPR